MSSEAPGESPSLAGDVSQQQQRQDEDEDDLSITSTNAEDNDSEKEWDVNDVLAERPHPNNPGVRQYLIMWEGFKLEDCTWEPVENLGEGLLLKWDENKSEIDAGTREIFDLATYDAACAGRAERHARRNAKRQRLGLPLTAPFPLEHTENTLTASPVDQSLFCSEDEAQEVAEVDDAGTPSSKSRAVANTPTSPLETATATSKPASAAKRAAKQTTFVGIPSTASRKDSSVSRMSEKSSDKPATPSLPKKPPAPPPSSLPKKPPPSPASSELIRKGSGSTMTGYQGTARRSSVFKHPTAKVPSQSDSPTTTTGPFTAKGPPALSSAQANASNTKRLTATRTRQFPPSSHTNVFAGGIQRKKRVNLADAMTDPSKEPKSFSTMHLRNLARKIGIEKGDKVGALSSIPRSFIIGNEPENPKPRKPSVTSSTTLEPAQSGEVPSGAISKPHVSREAPQKGNAEDVVPPKRKKTVHFTGEDDEGPMATTYDAFRDARNTNSTGGSRNMDREITAPPMTLPVMTHQLREQTQTIQKVVKFGHSEGILVGFNGITQQPSPWLSTFQSEETLHLASTCSSYHFKSQREHLIGEKLSAGTLEPALPKNVTALKNVSQSLQRGTIALHLVASEYSILVYPGDCTSWDWLEPDDKKPDSDILLRYLIFQSPIPLQAYPPKSQKEPKPSNEVLLSNGANDPEIVETLTGLDFKNMLPQNPKWRNKQTYMLLFPLKAQQLLGTVMAWLRAHQPGRPIFTVDQEDGWRLFHEDVQAGAGGTIISHADFTLWKLEKVPDVWRMLEDSRYTFWHLDIGENKWPQYPSDSDVMNVPGTFRQTRLFPYGRAFLITPSFVISEPAKLCEFLGWFLSYGRNPGHIIVTCHDFPRFLRNITEEKQKEHNNLRRLNPNNKDASTFFERAGRSKKDIDDHARAWQLYQEIMRHYGDEETSEDIRKIHWLSELIDPSDEQSLVNSFCWWTQLKCDRFRRFYVLGSDPTKIQRAYRYIEIPRYFDTEGSDPDIAGILAQRRFLAAELQKEADNNGTVANIAWNTNGEINKDFRGSKGWKISVCKAPFSFPGTLFHTDDVQALQWWMDGQKRVRGPNWAELHHRPVSWRDWNMAVQFGDGDEYGSRFDTFSTWFKAAPKFSRRKNTWYGIFYTITDTWDEYMPKQKYDRHPWIAIYRPKNPHYISPTGKFKTIELFIWDAAAADREKFGHGLLDMQCQLIDYVYESVPAVYDGCSLSHVWYGSSSKLQLDRADNFLDITCKRFEEMFQNGRDELPPMDSLLCSQWTEIDPRLWSAGMSSMTLRTKPEGKASEIALKRIPQTEEDKLKPERMIWHPIHGETRGRGTKCLNDLHEACLQARLRDPQCGHIEYRYRPTWEWWADQVAEGRGYGYINVDAGSKIIDKLVRRGDDARGGTMPEVTRPAREAGPR
ncbi:hypothetical protein F5Y14DRAFT_437165 [Nemania sp. NC0429]|nr:hypothetical protein F5Y14DRAFT_437165 [Nemania sp. NC0429]